MSTRIVSGLKLTRKMTSCSILGWVTEDGRFEFSRDHGAMTVCEQEHPVRGPRGTGYLCPGNEEHAVWTWSAWDTTIGDHAFDGDSGYDTLKQAVSWVVYHLKKETSQE